MKTWPRRIRGAVGMGLTWAAGWGIVAVLVGTIVDPDGSMDEMWVAVGAYPGFLGGVLFSVALGIAEGRRRLDQLSLSRVGGWGALAGLLVGVLPFVVGSPSSGLPPWLLGAVVVGSTTLLGAVSACASLAVARVPGERGVLDAGAGGTEVGSREDEARRRGA